MRMISIVVVNYNTRDLLRQCLVSLESHCPQAEIVVVDNASRDDSASMVRSEFPKVILVESATNLGFAGGNNLGLVRCRGRFILLFNSDATLEDDSLTRCVDWLRAHPNVGAVSPRLIGVDNIPQRCLYRFPSLRIKLRQMFRLPIGSEPTDDDGWLAGTALLIRRDALDAIGGALDDRYFMYWEDADLSARLRKAGWGIQALTDPYIRHFGGASGGGADENRPKFLQAWYVYGRHRWYARNRSFGEAAAIWFIDLLDVPRKIIRGTIHPAKRHERAQAIVEAEVLLRLLVGLRPPLPARPRNPEPSHGLSLNAS